MRVFVAGLRDVWMWVECLCPFVRRHRHAARTTFGPLAAARTPTRRDRFTRFAASWLAVACLAGGATPLHAQGGGSTVPALKFAFSAGGGLTTTYGQPIVIDLDRDGRSEIVFVSWAPLARAA